MLKLTEVGCSALSLQMASQGDGPPLYDENGSPLYDEDVVAAEGGNAAKAAKNAPKAQVKEEAAGTARRLFAAHTPENVDSADVLTNPYLPEGHPRRKSFDPTAVGKKKPSKLPSTHDDDDEDDDGPPPLVPRNCCDESDDDSDSDDDTPVLKSAWYAEATKKKKAAKPAPKKPALVHDLPGTIVYKGRRFSRQNFDKDGQTMRCQFYRKKQKGGLACPGRIHLSVSGVIRELHAEHNDPLCAEKFKLADAAKASEVVVPDITNAQKRYVDAEAIANLTKSANAIADECMEEMRGCHGDTFKGLTVKQLRRRVYNARQQHCGGAEKGRVTSEHMNGGVLSFCRAHVEWVDAKGERQEIMCFSKKALMDRLKAEGLQVSSKLKLNYAILCHSSSNNIFFCHFLSKQMFCDATFACVPSGFYQLLIIMIFDMMYKIYVPCYFILMSSKAESCYVKAFETMISDVGGRLKPAYVGEFF